MPRSSRSPGRTRKPLAIESLERRVLLDNAAPTLTFNGQATYYFRTNAQTFSIPYTASDPDSDATIRFYYDTDMRSANGLTALSPAISENSGATQYTWDLSNVLPGLYYIYGEITDGTSSANAWFQGALVVTTTGLNPIAVVDTSMGAIAMELRPDVSPITVANFRNYAQYHFYDNTIFHRVIKGFMIQGGGYYANGTAPTTNPAIYNENLYEPAKNLLNVAGSVAMARTSAPHTATSQFFINTVNNAFLDYQSDTSPGYCVFATVIDGFDVVQQIENVPVTSGTLSEAVPNSPVYINSIKVYDSPVFKKTSLTASATQHQAFAFDLASYDEMLGPVTYALVSPPSWLRMDNAASGAISGTPGTQVNGTVNVTVRVTRSDGRSTEAVLAINVQNVAPTVTSTPVTTATEDVPYTYDVSSNEDGTVTYRLIEAPGELSINPTTGLITGTFANGRNGKYTVRVGLTDAYGATAEQEYALTVLNAPPSFINAPSALGAATGLPFEWDFNTSDELVGEPVTYELINAPAWLSILDAAAGTIGGTPPDGTTGAANVTIRAVNDDAQTDHVFSLVVTDNQSGFFGQLPSAHEQMLIGQSFTFDFNSFSEMAGTATYSLLDAPSWLQINPTTGVLAGTPTLAAHVAADQPISVHVTDGEAWQDYSFDLDVLGQVVTLDPAQRRTSAVYTDADGDTVSVKLAGKTGVVRLVRAVAATDLAVPGNLYGIELDGTDAASSLTITVKKGTGDGLSTIEAVTGSGSLKSLAAKMTNLVGAGLILSGGASIQTLTFYDLLGGADIVLPGLDVIKGVTMNAHVIGAGSDIRLGSGLKALTLAAWSGGTLTAPWAGSISARGDTKAGLAGNLDIGLDVSGAGAAAGKPVVGKISATGALGGAWHIAGDLGTVSAGQILGDWAAQVSGTVKSVASKGDASGRLDAVSLGSISVGAQMHDAIIRLSQVPGTKVQALGSVSVKGWMRDSEIRTVGDIKSVSAAGMDGVTVFAGIRAGVTELPGSADFLAATATIGKVSVGGVSGAPASFRDTLIAAGALGTISVKDVAALNSARSFGFAAQSIKSVKANIGAARISLSKLENQADTTVRDDFRIDVF